MRLFWEFMWKATVLLGAYILAIAVLDWVVNFALRLSHIGYQFSYDTMFLIVTVIFFLVNIYGEVKKNIHKL